MSDDVIIHNTNTGEEPFRNREIREMFSDVKESLSEIKKQTTLTNGKVADLKLWKGIFSGAIAVILVVVLPLMAWVLVQVATQSNSIAVLNTKIHALSPSK